MGVSSEGLNPVMGMSGRTEAISCSRGDCNVLNAVCVYGAAVVVHQFLSFFPINER